ncbi:hypothetical protein OG874_01455 [Nocardia sp. NBC_00565]|uniref:hypothetical protein n=1 Tax=Nocardia sp. NBC_00565 TaxID=2975993 RepID=UPI002E82268C|nr:hypothetical protein [Nocardia sp. NBC_00565]WUC03912.1 hypothetical protein OG874_01455 [Nocardia sp. NBC_00565]
MLSDLVPSRPQEIAPTVRALLAAFNADTQDKLDLAPTDSAPIYQGADGALRRVVDGWISDFDTELDKADAITIQPTSVRDIEAESIDPDGPRGHAP